MAKQSNLIHVFKTYYLFYHKDHGNTKVYTMDDVSHDEIKKRYHIDKEFVYKGIFDSRTNKFITLNTGSSFAGSIMEENEQIKEESLNT